MTPQPPSFLVTPTVSVKVVKLEAAAQLPQYAHPDDAGLDLFAIAPTEILPGETALIGTGIALELPPGTEAQIRPRSGLALKHSITLLNSPGTIDAGYRGEIGVIVINHGKQPFQVLPGMKIAQMVIAPILRATLTEVTSLPSTPRGPGGFGSTGL
jgi:dUTP pyrophosphatase